MAHTQGRTFGNIAREWVAGRAGVWAQRHMETVVDRLVRQCLPGHREDIADVGPIDVLLLVKDIEARGAVEVAKRVLGICSQVFRYAVALQLVKSDPCRKPWRRTGSRVKCTLRR